MTSVFAAETHQYTKKRQANSLTDFITSILFLLVAALVAVVGFLLRRSALSKLQTQETPKKSLPILKTFGSILMVLGIWQFIVRLLFFLFGSNQTTNDTPSLLTQTISIGAFSISISSLVFLGIVIVLLVIALILRLLVIPHMKEKPQSIQSAMEIFVHSLSNCMNVRWSFIITVVILGAISIATILLGLQAPLNSFIWNFVAFLLAVLVFIAGFFLRRSTKTMASQSSSTSEKGIHRARLLGTIFMIVSVWTVIVRLLSLLFGPQEKKEFSVSIWAERVQIGSLDLSTTILLTWIVMAVLIVFAIILRIFVIPRMREKPRGIQAVLEIAIEAIAKYTDDKAPGIGDTLGSYIFTIAVFLVTCSITELFGIRVPMSDLTLTFAMALITFFLINYYGLKKKGILGRVKSLASPSPMVFPLRIISDIAVPVSLACRLFGNMLGGLIVMDLLYFALGTSAIGIPSVIGLYFNVFHPLIQAFIFITLSLTFINEAVE